MTLKYHSLSRSLPLSPAIPEDGVAEESEDEDKVSPDERISIRASDKRIAPDNEYSDSEDEGDGRRDERSFKPKKKTKTDEAMAAAANNIGDDKKDVVPGKDDKAGTQVTQNDAKVES